MQVVVTGAATPLGQSLLRALAARGTLALDAVATPVTRILGVDREQTGSLFVDERVEYVCGAYEQPRFLARMMGAATDAVFHLAVLAAAQGVEANADGLDRALLRSLDSTRALLEACRLQLRRPRLVYAGRLGLRASPEALPRDIDGVCIDLCELLLAESARRGVVELRSLRLPDLALGARPELLDAAAAALIDAHEWAGAAPLAPALRVLQWDACGGLTALEAAA